MSGDSYEQKGLDYRQQADKKLKGGTFARMFSSGREEAAVDLLEKAATQFKLGKSCEAPNKALLSPDWFGPMGSFVSGRQRLDIRSLSCSTVS